MQEHGGVQREKLLAQKNGTPVLLHGTPRRRIAGLLSGVMRFLRWRWCGRGRLLHRNDLVDALGQIRQVGLVSAAEFGR